MRVDHEVHVFEKDHRLGGHTNTQQVDDAHGSVFIDTGFIVHNDRNYPRLTNLFELLGVAVQDSDMSFAASINRGSIEYAGDALFAQRSNLLRPSHWKMLIEVVRFNRLAKAALLQGTCGELALGDWLDQHRFGSIFENRYLLPMAASIWSTPSRQMRAFSAQTFLEFFNNHGLLDLSNRPQWKTLRGGSRSYLEKMAADLAGHIHSGRGVVRVNRGGAGVQVIDDQGQSEQFDAVVFGAHADQTLHMLEDADDAERSLLGAFEFRENRAVLHSDESLMPKRRKAWSSWNYLTECHDEVSVISLSYWMNRLQRLETDQQYFVTLNPVHEPRPELVHYETVYTHPVFNVSTRQAQASMGLLQGHRSCWYCGAWMGYGFHEDGLGSAIEAVKSIGVGLPPSLEEARRSGPPYMDNKLPWTGLGGHLLNA